MKRIIPQKDGLYAITLNNLGYITPTDVRFYMEDNMDDNLITGESLNNVYTLVSYKGNGLFQEYYSGEYAVLCVSFSSTEQAPINGVLSSFNEERLLSFDNEQQKKAKFDFFKKIPLSVDASSLINITPEIIANINSNNLGDSIRQYISGFKSAVILHEFEGVPYETSNKTL
ncbi:MAG: hypothetical protein IJO63_01090 [Bacilli bacterium]|nr:hypothetical protein [Bacilli bacterium]